MKGIVYFLFLFPCLAFAEQVRVSTGMDGREVSRIFGHLGADDLSGVLSVVGPDGEWPTRSGYWSFSDYHVVVEIVQKDGSLALMYYWAESDFGHSLQRREATRAAITSIVFDTDTKEVETKESKARGKKAAEPGATDNPGDAQ